MDFVLRDIKAQLVDGTLNAIVPTADILAAFTAEISNYPAITLDTVDGSAVIGLSGINNMKLEVTVFSNVSKLQAYEIYDLVRALLHNQELAITSADRLFHAIYETSTPHSYDAGNDVWKVTAQYQIIYAVSGTVATSGASGVIYAATSGVTAIAGNKIADYRGDMILDLGYEIILQTEQERFAKAFYAHAGRASLVIEEVIFKEAILEKLYGIIKNVSDTLADGVTASTSRTVTQSIGPVALELLWQSARTDDGKTLEIQAGKVLCPAIRIPFPRRDVALYNCEFILLGDSSDNVVKTNTEN